MNKILNLIGRKKELFSDDIKNLEKELSSIVLNSTFLVIGGAGSINQAVTKEIFKRNPKKFALDKPSAERFLYVHIESRGQVGQSDYPCEKLDSLEFFKGINK